jgi:endoglycosylceramidase
MAMKRRILVSAAVLLVAAVPVGAQPAPGLDRLRAAGRFVVDDSGRVVILRGFNVSQRRPPYVPTWLSDTDAARMASLGANVARIAVSWAGAEPERGRYSEQWLQELLRVIATLNAHGIYAVVEIHQSGWSEKYGGDGAPEWANWDQLPGGSGAGVGDPRAWAEFMRFWTDADGVQTAFVDMWRWLAGALGPNPGVAGFDFMNEPFPGFVPPGVFEQTFLIPFYRRIIDAVRAVAPHTTAFVEPPVWGTQGIPSTMVGLGRDNVVYAPHVYPWLTWSWFTPVVYPGHPATLAGDYAVHNAEAASMGGVPWWVGEWGVVREATNAAEYVRDGARLQEQMMLGSAWWEYAGPRDDRFSPVDSDPGRTLLPYARALVRPYPRAIAGTPDGYRFDETSRIFSLTVSRADGTSELFVPSLVYPNGVRIVCRPVPCAGISFETGSQLAYVTVNTDDQETISLSPP